MRDNPHTFAIICLTNKIFLDISNNPCYNSIVNRKEIDTMPKCPYCGSASHVIALHEEYTEDGWEITLVRHYKCEACKKYFHGTTIYRSEGYEIIEED